MSKIPFSPWLRGLVLAVLALGPVDAGAQANFGASAEDIVRALTPPAEAEKPRSKGLTRNLIMTAPAAAPAASLPGGAPAPATPVKTASVNLKIQFAPNSNSIQSQSLALLGELGKALRSDALTGKRVVVAGHTDSDGVEQTNRRLSLGRAQAVKRILVEQYGLDSRNILVVPLRKVVDVEKDVVHVMVHQLF